MTVKTFNLPDLGEGLPEAEIVSWLVAEGDSVTTDQPMLSVETAKAVVEVPAPYTGRIVKIHAPDGTILPTHAPLVDIDTSGGMAAAPSKAAEAPAGSPAGAEPGRHPPAAARTPARSSAR
jgi:2-oxoisovalerate dehydrogenase E2 component (dihydrolipoyl transacylase)